MNVLWIILALLLVNLFSYYSMYRDKQSAKKGAWRTPELHFYAMGLFFGAVGVILGTRSPLFHKINKYTFKGVVYFTLLCNLALLGLLGYQFNEYLYFELP